MGNRKTTCEFIAEAQNIHGNKYDYSKVEYRSNKRKVCIICPKHGEFWQRPDKHLRGQGCPVCAGTEKSDTASFIEKARKIHGDKYDYSKVEYSGNKNKVCIICPEHGEFWQDPHNHLKGKGCPECGKLKLGGLKYTSESFKAAAETVHGTRYDYSKAIYKGTNEELAIICPEHGEFQQRAYIHLMGGGCPICAKNTNGLKRRENTENFIRRARETHGDKYDYSKTDYVTAKNKVCIICPKHGEFWQSSWNHLRGNGCPKCVHPTSRAETEIYDFIKANIGDTIVEKGNRTVLDGKEMDIYIPSLKIGIEYNGLYWHQRERNYHVDKTNLAREKGIGLIQIFEDEYVQHKEIVLNKILHILGKGHTLGKVMGRKCKVMEIEMNEARDFLEKNHIQGFGRSTVYIGAFYNEKLIGVMSFRREGDEWELTRFATDMDFTCQGVGGKLLKYFVSRYNPLKIKSFADRRWTINEDNNLYAKLGFKFDSYTLPDYRYYNPKDGCVRHHKFGFRKERLHRKYGLPTTMTEREMTEKLGYTRIYDCGLIKYVWAKE